MISRARPTASGGYSRTAPRRLGRQRICAGEPHSSSPTFLLPASSSTQTWCGWRRSSRAQRDALIGLSQKPNPRVVLLTPGPHNETYFEHSYIARYLGFTLVEGADLTVRDRAVFLKTVDGLEQVDVILRRVDDSFCDPLELRGDSLLGVPGLVDAIVAGNVKVANALGSGVIETSAVMPFLPGLCKQLLGENLLLPSVATWWCGQEYALDWVLNNLESVVIKPAFPSRGMEPVFGAGIAHAEKAKLAAQLRLVGPTTMLRAGADLALHRAGVGERAHGLPLRRARAHMRAEYRQRMDRAARRSLTRVAEDCGSVVSMQRGGHSKDAMGAVGLARRHLQHVAPAQ